MAQGDRADEDEEGDGDHEEDGELGYRARAQAAVSEAAAAPTANMPNSGSVVIARGTPSAAATMSHQIQFSTHPS